MQFDPTTSCLYTGRVMHRRLSPVRRRFAYGLSWLYLNLDEVQEQMRRVRLLTSGRWGLVSFRRDDHLGEPQIPLSDSVRSLVAEQTGAAPAGPICLLTQPRSWGRYFSPLNLYYCFDESGQRVEAVVGEVSNTPWRERHCYVLTPEESDAAATAQHSKAFHVSPFLPMGMEYAWRLTAPGESLTVSLLCKESGAKRLATAMRLERQELTSANLLATSLRYPGGANRILAAIYWQALLIWIRRCPYYPHPHNLSPTPSPTTRATTP